MKGRLPLPRALALVCLLALGLGAERTLAAAYYLGEIGPRSLARAGAVIVNPGDPTAIWLNPAAITHLHGTQLRLDATLIFMDATFVRDCGPNNDCGPRTYKREYRDGRVFEVDGEARAEPFEGDEVAVFEPTKENLGRLNTPSRFADGHAVRNQAGPQPVPHLWAVMNADTFGLDGLAFGAAVFAPYVGDYKFAADEYTRYTLIDRDLLEVYYSLTAAYRFRNWIAVGASLQGVSAGVKQQVKLSADPGGNEDPGYDVLVDIDVIRHFIPSANFGLWSSPLPGLELGASVQLGRSVRATGPLDVVEIGERAEAFLESAGGEIQEDNPRATVEFELPAFARAGVKYGREDLLDGLFGFDVELDFVWEGWSSYDHVYLEAEGVSFSFSGQDPIPLKPVIQPKNYQDAWSVRLGGDLHFLEKMLQVRGGVAYETAAIPNETFSVELLNGEKIALGLGGSVKLFGVTLDVGYAHMFLFDRQVGDESIVHAENAAPPTVNPERRTRVAMGRYQTSYDVVSVGLNVAFDEMLGLGVYAPKKTEPAPEAPSLPGKAEGGERPAGT